MQLGFYHFFDKLQPRRLSPKKLALLRKELSPLEELEIIRPSSFPWGSPVHMVKNLTDLGE